MRQLTIGILSPLLDGFYYGNLHYAIHRQAQVRGVKLITVRTMDEFRFDLPLAFERADGWIVLRRGVSEQYLEKLQQSGKPVTVIGRQSLVCHAIQVDDREGMFEACMHLIEHGHRRIAFIGDIEHPAMKLRFEGYQAALSRGYIRYNPALTIVPTESHYAAGAEAADRIIEMNFPCTAVVASTDLIAFGLMDRLRERGYRIPEDLAVTGFDGVAPAATYHPSLTTSAQPYDAIGETAVDWIIGEIYQQNTKDISPIILPTKLAVRHSCGCTGEDEPDTSGIGTLSSKDMNIKALNYFEQVIQNNLEFSKLLFQSTTEGLGKLSAMLPPGVRWGLLALWEEGRPAGTTLRIAHYFHKDPLEAKPDSFECLPGHFPPIERLSAPFYLDEKDMLALMPVRSENKEWGVLALAGEYDITRTYGSSDAMTHFFNMIAFALEREQLFEELRTREYRYRSLAEKLEIVSRSITDGIWEWDLLTDKMEHNLSFRAMLNWPDDKAGTIHDFIRDIHPADRDVVVKELFEGWDSKDKFEAEFRLLQDGRSPVWVFCAGSCIRDPNGPPIRIVGSVRDITADKEHERQIEFLAFHDSLTGLPNRLFLAESLKTAIEHASRHNHKLALLLFDLDDFKAINDNYGHLVGDRLLKYVAHQLTNTLRLEHIVARLAGDEFVILLPFIQDEKEAVGASKAILGAFEKPFVEGELEIEVSGSLGVSIYPYDGEDSETLFSHTDIAMYQAKNSGKNQFAVYSTGVEEIPLASAELERKLRLGLANSEFELYYQPQVDLRTGRLYGAEALLRWRTEGGMLYPDDFIPVAEETGLIIPLGRFVLEEACKQYAIWKEQGLSLDRLSINLSAKQLADPAFPDMVIDVIRSRGVDPSAISLEVTETAAVQDMQATLKLFEKLREHGVEISLDDFGTGYSSLVSLKRYPIGNIKIDRSFIGSINRSAKDASIVRAIITLAHSLGLSVIAEGVESIEELELLRAMRCDSIQGFYVDKPLPAEQFADKFLNPQSS